MPLLRWIVLFFDAYNKCDMDKQAEIYADTRVLSRQRRFNDIKQEILAGTKKIFVVK
jgi:hypothetical protein